jgi:hypothetical protein
VVGIFCFEGVFEVSRVWMVLVSTGGRPLKGNNLDEYTMHYTTSVVLAYWVNTETKLVASFIFDETGLYVQYILKETFTKGSLYKKGEEERSSIYFEQRNKALLSLSSLAQLIPWTTPKTAVTAAGHTNAGSAPSRNLVTPTDTGF